MLRGEILSEGAEHTLIVEGSHYISRRLGFELLVCCTAAMPELDESLAPRAREAKWKPFLWPLL